MLDIKFIRENPEIIKNAIRVKKMNVDIDNLLKIDEQIRALKTEIQNQIAEKNRISKSIPTATDRAPLIAESKKIGDAVVESENKLRELEQTFMDIMYSVPNIPADDAPLGNDEHDNIVIKTVGKKPEFKFEPLDHIQLLEKNNWADFTGAANVSGSRAYALRGDVARLEMALWMFAMDKLNKHGFTPITVPSMVREGALYGTGMFPGSRDEIYQLPNDDLYLAGTAEVALTSLHSGQMLTENQLPILYAGFSPCFRREAGSYGRDVRGLIRVHQFMKVEQFVICKNDPDESRKWHTALLNITMEILDDLNLHYQVVDCCTGDMGQGKVRMNDVNTWLPSQNTFRETHSCSTFHEYQSRRADLRYRENGSNDVKFCHTLNNTAVATPRILANILENYQNADGSVTVPEILRPYLGGLETLTPAK